MIDQMDRFIKTWIEGIAPAVEVVFQVPDGAAPADNTVLVRLLSATPTLPPRDTAYPLLQIALCYLVTVYHSDTAAAHLLLGDLIFSAMQNPAFKLSVEPPPLELWTSLGSPPQPAFRIEATIRRERPRRPVHPVLHALKVEMIPAADLHGMVLGPEDQPIAGATVECPDLGLYTHTDHDGRFHLPMVPGSNADLNLVITVKGTERTVTVSGTTTYEAPFIVHVDPTENPVES